MNTKKEQLCKCNNCGLIMYDENPNRQPYFKAPKNTTAMVIGKENCLGCPNCKTDAYLSDVLTEPNWICTDSSCNQYCKKISDTEFKYKQDIEIDENLTRTVEEIIDVLDYATDEIENIISSYGYSINPLNVKEFCNLMRYGEDVYMIIAECIFEQGVI